MLQNYEDVHAPERLYSEHGSYRFNIESISKDILEGKEILYEEVDHELGLEPPEDNKQVGDLSEDELFHIARSFFEYHWQDGMNDWALRQITYRALDCEKGMSGMVFAIYDFEKYYENEGKLIMRSNSIQSWDGIIDWWEYAERKDGSHHAIDIDNYTYNATQAFARVEQKGGGDARNNSKEACKGIYITTYSGSTPEWTVEYVFSETEAIYFNINALTGKVNKHYDSHLLITKR